MRNDRVVGWRPPRKGRRWLIAILVLAGMLAAVMVVRALRFGAAPPPPVAAVAETAPDGATGRLAQALRFGTVSHQDSTSFPAAAFDSLHDYLAAAFPLVRDSLVSQRIAGHSVLYEWHGADPALPPVLLLAHLDVVPVEPGRPWTRPPFGGQVADGLVWGRGALDDKAGALAILESVESLLAEGFRPRRTVLIAFGHDEEVGGQGARAVAAVLQRRDIRPWLVLDEGGALVDGVLDGLPLTAMIGIAEKGYLSIQLEAEGAGGHSSAPPARTAAGLVAAAATRVQDSPMPPRLEGVTGEFLHRVGRSLPFTMRIALANLWLTEPLVARRLGADPATNALVRTTTAVTMLAAGHKENVLPQSARAVINFRLLPGDDAAGVLEHVRRAVDDERVTASPLAFASEASPVSPAGGPVWDVLARSVREIWPQALVAPYLTVGATDARHYAGLSDHVYRFLPVPMTSEDLVRIHGTDERIGVDDYADAIRFYRRFIRNAAG